MTESLSTTKDAFAQSKDWTTYLESLEREGKARFGDERSIDAAIERYRRWVAAKCGPNVLRADDYEFTFTT